MKQEGSRAVSETINHKEKGINKKVCPHPNHCYSFLTDRSPSPRTLVLVTCLTSVRICTCLPGRDLTLRIDGEKLASCLQLELIALTSARRGRDVLGILESFMQSFAICHEEVAPVSTRCPQKEALPSLSRRRVCVEQRTLCER